MKNISKLVSENRLEAYDLIEKNGGRVKFGEKYDNDLPIVLMGEPIAEFKVLEVWCGKEYGDIEFIAFDIDLNETLGECNYAECAYDTDKEIYEFLGEFLDVPYDSNGVEIKKGQKVLWTDPETKSTAEYEVFEKPTREMVKLWSEFGECEALPFECLVLSRDTEV